MNIALWVLQGLLALAFLMAGLMKVSRSKEQLVGRMAWVEDYSQKAIKAIGGVEMLGAIGLVLPALTGILPWLTPLAACGLALTMMGANITHIRRGEAARMTPSVVLLLLAMVVAYGRFVVYPF
jgi:uncharacterized membrane protein YphA (DoxX/SURF4 family)